MTKIHLQNLGDDIIDKINSNHLERVHVYGSLASPIDSKFEVEIIPNIMLSIVRKGTLSAHIDFYTKTGTEFVDIRYASIYSGGASEAFYYDSHTLTTTPLMVDIEYYIHSNEKTICMIRKGERVYEIHFLVSGGGARINVVSEPWF